MPTRTWDATPLKLEPDGPDFVITYRYPTQSEALDYIFRIGAAESQARQETPAAILKDMLADQNISDPISSRRLQTTIACVVPLIVRVSDGKSTFDGEEAQKLVTDDCRFIGRLMGDAMHLFRIFPVAGNAGSPPAAPASGAGAVEPGSPGAGAV